MFRFTLLNHLCRDMEQVHDTSRPPDRIRQDVTRSPGGDSSMFLNNCIGCHSGMDPMAQAFAYYDFDETQSRLVYTQGQVQPKYLINSDNFKPGFVTPDDHWENRWRLPGQNTLLGWVGEPARQRQRREVARPGAGEQRRVRAVPGGEGVPHASASARRATTADRTQVDDRSSTSFKSSGYNLKTRVRRDRRVLRG